ncbi:RNA polymerase sigma factor, sigma-70 family [Friedmanniella luteola]|uniref:RNA polymerase sigma factor, sigma-70 family n=1 Tax=Friedmanniella luteola TaxID=546871 RepID=A0A1H1YPS7_9ACTN|nr:sigma-70 family RNA polymerase sigma factor [Friedmanniella luteola]SDT23485.1 RNA polymerase sigma factor, sigma-70 family [Friedmanniella luteola]
MTGGGTAEGSSPGSDGRLGSAGGEEEPERLAVRAARLFLAYRDGDAARMADLVRLVTPVLWHTARGARLDAATAEDVLQSVWLALVRHADTITEPVAVLQWLVVSTKRESWRVSRAQTRTRPEDFEATDSAAATVAEAVPVPSVEEEVLEAAADSALWRHIAQLPERCRALLRVIAFADRPDYAELSKALGMPQGSIGPTRGRCLAKLRLALAADPAWETP